MTPSTTIKVLTYVVLIRWYDETQLVWAGTDCEEAVRRVREKRAQIVRVSSRWKELVPPDAMLDGTVAASLRFREQETIAGETMEREFVGEFGDDWLALAYWEPRAVGLVAYDPEQDEFVPIEVVEEEPT